jgi:hypothetical protein
MTVNINSEIDSMSKGEGRLSIRKPRRGAALLLILAAATLALAIFLTLAEASEPSAADTLCVKPDGEDGCLTSINDALALAQENDTIQVAAGMYVENVHISQTVTLQGGWALDFSVRDLGVFSSTIVPANNTQSVVAIEGQSGNTNAVAPTLDGFVITGGRADLGGYHGGGLQIVDSNAHVISNTIQHNVAYLLGGGIWVQRGAPSLEGNHIENNIADGPGQVAYGGGVQLENSQATLAKNVLVGNVVSGTEAFGGGIAIIGTDIGQVTLMRNQVISNVATAKATDFGFGGGIAVSSGKVQLGDSMLISNTAGNGGGLMIGAGGVISLTNIALIENRALQDGGAIHNVGFISVTNTTVSGNEANGEGGGIANFDSAFLLNSTVSDNGSSIGAGLMNANMMFVQNSLIAQNLGDNCSGGLSSLGYNLEDGGTCALGHATDQDNTPPAMDSLADNGGGTSTHALMAGSLAIDQIPVGVSGCGTNVATDQRGVGRPQGTACDIGAFEVEGISNLSATNDGPTALGQATTLSATVQGGDSISYTWAFGDGAIGIGPVVKHTYPTVGMYTATVTATNSINLETATTMVTIAEADFPIYLPVVLKE